MWNVEQSVERDAARPRRPQHGAHQYVINASQSVNQPTSYTQLANPCATLRVVLKNPALRGVSFFGKQTQRDFMVALVYTGLSRLYA